MTVPLPLTTGFYSAPAIEATTRPRAASLRRLSGPAAALSFVAALFAAGCSSGDDDDNPSFKVNTAPNVVLPGAPITVAGRYAVYLANEGATGAAGLDLNDDMDELDSVAMLIDLQTGTTTSLEVAARSAVILGTRLFLVVSEAEDNTNWDGQGSADALVVLTTSVNPIDLQYVDTLAGGLLPHVVATDTRVWYAAAEAPLAGETTLRYVDADAPLVPVAVLAVTGETQESVRPLEAQAGVLFCFLDETADGIDHNGAGGATSTTVLGLVDALADVPHVRNTGFALANAGTPRAARAVPGGDRAVAFLVSETLQAQNLNELAGFAPGWLPSQCSVFTADDADQSDDILHWLLFDMWDADPILDAPVNTGLAGGARVLLLDGHVVTLVDEAAQGAGCDYNSSSDTDDSVARWVALAPGAVPEASTQLNLAIATNVGGGGSGLAVLDGRLIAAIDVTDNASQVGSPLNTALAGKRILAATRPGVNGTWAFSHFDPNVPNIQIGVNWLAPAPDGPRLGVGIDESVPLIQSAPFIDRSLNFECGGEAQDNDTTDTIAGWIRFNGNAVQLFGVGFALHGASPGITLAAGNAFFRVSENQHNVDFNGDGDNADAVLVRRPFSSCNPSAMTVHNFDSQAAILTDGIAGALLLLDESLTQGPNAPLGLDINQDGKVGGFVIRHFRF